VHDGICFCGQSCSEDVRDVRSLLSAQGCSQNFLFEGLTFLFLFFFLLPPICSLPFFIAASHGNILVIYMQQMVVLCWFVKWKNCPTFLIRVEPWHEALPPPLPFKYCPELACVVMHAVGCRTDTEPLSGSEDLWRVLGCWASVRLVQARSKRTFSQLLSFLCPVCFLHYNLWY